MNKLLAVVLFVVVATASSSALIAQQVRFRDEVFTQVTRENAVIYGSAVNHFTSQNEELLLDWYEPTGDTMVARPAVVIVHGGGFTGGSRATSAFEEFATRFAQCGYVAISVDYRLAPAGTQITVPIVRDAVHDYQAAVRWLRTHAAARRIDPERILALGSSAGAITVLESANGSHGEGHSGNPGVSSRVQLVVDLWGAAVNPTAMQSAHPPLMIVHGTNDLVVPFVAAQQLLAGAQSAGVPHEFHPIQRSGHAPFGLYLSLHFADTLAFAWQHLDLAMIGGLVARPGYASPGWVEIEQHGLAGSMVLIAFGATPGPVPVPGLGELCFDPAGFALVANSAWMPVSPRIATVPTALWIPRGFTGFTVHWQAVEYGPMPWLTNCVTTTF